MKKTTLALFLLPAALWANTQPLLTFSQPLSNGHTQSNRQKVVGSVSFPSNEEGRFYRLYISHNNEAIFDAARQGGIANPQKSWEIANDNKDKAISFNRTVTLSEGRNKIHFHLVYHEGDRASKSKDIEFYIHKGAANYDINFQPAGYSLPSSNTVHLADRGEAYDSVRGYGWQGSSIPLIEEQIDLGEDKIAHFSTYVKWPQYNRSTWGLDLINGRYAVQAVAYGPSSDDLSYERKVRLEGAPYALHAQEVFASGGAVPAYIYYLDAYVDVTDGQLSLENITRGGDLELSHLRVQHIGPANTSKRYYRGFWYDPNHQVMVTPLGSFDGVDVSRYATDDAYTQPNEGNYWFRKIGDDLSASPTFAWVDDSAGGVLVLRASYDTAMTLGSSSLYAGSPSPSRWGKYSMTMEANRPVAAFGVPGSGVPLRVGEAYSFGLTAGIQHSAIQDNNSLFAKGLIIEAYNKSAINSAGVNSSVSPVATQIIQLPNPNNPAEWSAFADAGFVDEHNANGLKTTIRYTEEAWGVTYDYPLLVTHEAQHHNYYYLVKVGGLLKTHQVHTQLARKQSLGANSVDYHMPLYALSFSPRPLAWQKQIIQKLNFDKQPMPSEYVGSTKDQLLTDSRKLPLASVPEEMRYQKFQVFMKYKPEASNASNARLTIPSNDPSGYTELRINQRTGNRNWQPLGVHDISLGRIPVLTLDDATSNGPIIADAIKLRKMVPGDIQIKTLGVNWKNQPSVQTWSYLQSMNRLNNDVNKTLADGTEIRLFTDALNPTVLIEVKQGGVTTVYYDATKPLQTDLSYADHLRAYHTIGSGRIHVKYDFNQGGTDYTDEMIVTFPELIIDNKQPRYASYNGGNGTRWIEVSDAQAEAGNYRKSNPAIGGSYYYFDFSELVIDSPELILHPKLEQFATNYGSRPKGLLRWITRDSKRSIAQSLTRYVFNEVALTDALEIGPNSHSLNWGGLNRNAYGVLLEGMGAPAEQTALLVNLLRLSGLEAYYVIPPKDETKLLEHSVSRMIGIQVEGAIDATGELYGTEFDSHSGASVVPANYPWAVVDIKDDQGNPKWVQLFPWMKDHEITEGFDLFSLLGEDYDSPKEWIQAYLENDVKVTRTDGTVVDILAEERENGIDTPSVVFPRYIEEVLQASGERISTDDIGIKVKLRKQNFADWESFPEPMVLPANAALEFYSGLRHTMPWSRKGDGPFNTVRVEVRTSSANFSHIDTGPIRIMDLHNRPFYLAWTADLSKLRLMLDRFSTRNVDYTDYSSTSNDFNRTSWNSRLIPFLYDEQMLGKHFGSSGVSNLTVKVQHVKKMPNASNQLPGVLGEGFPSVKSSLASTVERPFRRGELAAISLNIGRFSLEMLNEQMQVILADEAKPASSFNNDHKISERRGRMAYSMGSSYFNRIGRYEHRLYSLFNVSPLSIFTFGLAKFSPEYAKNHTNLNQSSVPNVDMSMLIQKSVRNQSTHIDRSVGQVNKLAEFIHLTVLENSAQEHQVINTMFQRDDAISTVRLLQLSNERGNPMIKVNATTDMDALGSNPSLNKEHNDNRPLAEVYDSTWDTVISKLEESPFSYAYLTPGRVKNSDTDTTFHGIGALIFAPSSGSALINNDHGGKGSSLEKRLKKSQIQNYNLDLEHFKSSNGDIIFEFKDTGPFLNN